MDRLKIAVLGTRGFPNVQGGVESHCENLYTRLAQKKIEISVFTRACYVDISLRNYKGVKLVHISSPKNKYFEAFVHTFNGVIAAKRLKADVVCIHATGPSLFVPLARILGMKVIMTNHGPDYERRKWKGLPKLILLLGEYLGSKYANSVISVSEFNAERLRRKYKRQINFIPNGVNIPKILKSDNALKKYGLVKRKYILAVGRFVPEKGFEDLIDAFDTVSGSKRPLNDNPDSRLLRPRSEANFSCNGHKLVIVGRADHEDKYSLGLKKKSAVNPNIILTGFLSGEPLQELYSHAGLFVLTSYCEGLSIALLEALSYGLSCLASDIPSNREAGLSEDRLFKKADSKALANKIKEFIDKPFREEERRAQIDMMALRYNWEKIEEETLKVYKA